MAFLRFPLGPWRSNCSTASSGDTGLTGRPVPSSRPAISRNRGWISQCQWYVASTLSRSGAVCRTRLCGGPSSRASRPGPGAAPPPWTRCPRRRRDRSRRRGGAARSRPRTATGTRTARRRRWRRPARSAASPIAIPRAQAGSTGTRLRGSGSAPRRRSPRRRGAGSAAGRRDPGRGGWSGRRPARPSSGRPAGTRSGRAWRRRRGSLAGDREHLAQRARCRSAAGAGAHPGGATIVRQLPEARACDSATWARLRSISRASSLRPDDVERVVLEGPDPDAVARRLGAVLALAAVVHRSAPQREAAAVELAIDDRGDPPAGDGVAAQLEEAGAHQPLARRRRDRGRARASSAPARRGPRAGSARGGSAPSSGAPERAGRAPSRRRRRRRATDSVERLGGLVALAGDRGRIRRRACRRRRSARSRTARTVTLRAMPW